MDVVAPATATGKIQSHTVQKKKNPAHSLKPSAKSRSKHLAAAAAAEEEDEEEWGERGGGTSVLTETSAAESAGCGRAKPGMESRQCRGGFPKGLPGCTEAS